MKKTTRTKIAISFLFLIPTFASFLSMNNLTYSGTKITNTSFSLSPKFSQNVIKITCYQTDSKNIASNIYDYQLEEYSRPFYNNDKEAPGYGKDNIRIKIVSLNNLEGTIVYKAFPEKYIENSTIVENNLTDPTYFQLFEISGFEKVSPTQFKKNINIDVSNFDQIWNNFLPSRIKMEQLRQKIAEQINIFLENKEASINVPFDLGVSNIVIDPSSIINNDAEGIKQLSFKLNKFFDISGNIVEGTTTIASPLISFYNFGKDLLGNGQVITNKTNTIFKINERINLLNIETFSDKLASSFISNEDELINICKKYGNFEISSAFNFDNFTFVSKQPNNFLGTIEITLQIPKYIENGQVIEKAKNISTLISGFGQALLIPDHVTNKDISTKIVANGSYDLNFGNVIASNVTIEQIKAELDKKQIVVDGLSNNKFEIILQERDDSEGVINTLIVVKQYIKNGRLVEANDDEKLWLISPIKLIGFEKTTAKNWDQIYLWSFLSSTIAITLIFAAIVIYLILRNKKKLAKYGIIESKDSKKKITFLSRKEEPKKLITNTTTYEEYYVPSEDKEILRSDRKFDIDDIISDITIDLNSTNQEDTIDRMLNEIDDDDL